MTWSAAPVGGYTLTAKAIDNQGFAKTSTAVAITVNPNQPPGVMLTSPLANDSFKAPASITLAATASDVDGTIAQVEFYQGTTLIGTATSAPYTVVWSNVAAGSYSLTAKAVDNGGGSRVSGATSIMVDPAGTQVYYLHTDHLNTPRLVMDEASQVVWRQAPLTEPFASNPPDEDPDGNGRKFILNLRFPGQYFDKETNLHYNTFRDYDPTTGRYIQSDPIGLQGGINTYGYVGGNPLGYSDPLGLDRQATGPAVVITDMSGGRTTFYDPQNPSSYTEIQSSNKVTIAAHARDADTPYHGKVTICQRGRLGAPYGTAKLRTTDPRSRWVHGGGSGLSDPYAPQQGWKPTEGCTRAQNEDVEELCDLVEEYQQSHPGIQIPYGRF